MLWSVTVLRCAFRRIDYKYTTFSPCCKPFINIDIELQKSFLNKIQITSQTIEQNTTKMNKLESYTQVVFYSKLFRKLELNSTLCCGFVLGSGGFCGFCKISSRGWVL